MYDALVWEPEVGIINDPVPVMREDEIQFWIFYLLYIKIMKLVAKCILFYLILSCLNRRSGTFPMKNSNLLL